MKVLTYNTRFLILGLFTAGIGLIASRAQAQEVEPEPEEEPPVCGDDVKKEVLEALAKAQDLSEKERLAAESRIYRRYQRRCLPQSWPRWLAITARGCGARVSSYGSTYYEDMPCCGYDPQKRLFGCPVRIKRQTWYGITLQPGSREYVLNCVQDSTGNWREVGHDSVHLSSSKHQPTWQFGVMAFANENMSLVQPLDGRPANARSILSWALEPTGCDYRPIWGNVIDYKIRLDP